MAKHLETGQEGERIASEFLVRKGYAILERNYKARRAEIDIIAREGGVIVFVEVKTRSGTAFGWPEQAVSHAKQQRIAQAAETYLLDSGTDDEIRFDIISILHRQDGSRQIYHIRDAFAP